MERRHGGMRRRHRALLGGGGLVMLVLLVAAALTPALPARAEAIMGAAIPVGAGTHPFAVAADPVHHRVYVAQANTVTVLDGRTNTQVGSPIAIAAGVQGIAVNPANQRLYVSNATTPTVTVITVANGANTIVGSAIPVGTIPAGLAVDSTTNRIYVAHSSSTSVSVIDGNSPANGGAGGTLGSASGIDIGAPSLRVAVDTDNHRVYVTLPNAGSLRVIDSASTANGGAGDTVGDPIPLVGAPLDVAILSAPGSSRVYVTIDNGSVALISGLGGGTAGEGVGIGSPISTGSAPAGVAVNPITGRVYVTDSTANTVTVIDAQPGQSNPTGSIDGPPFGLGNGAGPVGLAVSTDTGFVYVANASADTVSVIGTPFLAQAPIGSAITTGTNPFVLAVNPTTNHVFVANIGLVTDPANDTVSAIDGTTNQIIGPPITVGNLPFAIAVNPITNRVYTTVVGDLTDTANDVVVVIDDTNNRIINPPIIVGNLPTAVDVNLVTNRIYVANAEAQGSPGTVHVIDGVTGARIGSPIPVGISPGSIAVNPRSNRVYVANQTDHTVTVIDGATSTGGAGAVIGSPIPLPTTPDTVAVNPVTNRVYVGSAAATAVLVIDGSSGGTAGEGALVGKPILIAFNSSGLTSGLLAVNSATNHVYMAVDDTVVEIDAGGSGNGGAGDRVGAPVPAGAGARAAAINLATNRTYVADVSDPNTATGDGVTVLGPSLSSDKTVVTGGTATTVQVTFGELFGASGGDRFGLFAARAASNTSPVTGTTRFTNGTPVSGGVGLAQGSVDLSIPADVAPGRYEIRLVSGQNGRTLGALALRVLARPVAIDDAYTLGSSPALTVPASTGLLANDTDADSTKASLKAEIVTQPTRGTVTLQVDGSFTYTPRTSDTGADSFTYRVTDSDGLTSAPATVALNVIGIPCGPRPSVTVTTQVANGALLATITANDLGSPTRNRLQTIAFGALDAAANAQVTLNGQPVTSDQTVTLPANTTTQTFTVRRAAADKATTVRFTVTDLCGPWPTFVGGGTGAAF